MAELRDLFGTADPEEYRKKLALALTQQGLDSSPIKSPWQGAARLAQALVGGLQMNDIASSANQEKLDQTNAERIRANLPSLGSFGTGGSAQPGIGSRIGTGLQNMFGGMAQPPDGAAGNYGGSPANNPNLVPQGPSPSVPPAPIMASLPPPMARGTPSPMPPAPSGPMGGPNGQGGPAIPGGFNDRWAGVTDAVRDGTMDPVGQNFSPAFASMAPSPNGPGTFAPMIGSPQGQRPPMGAMAQANPPSAPSGLPAPIPPQPPQAPQRGQGQPSRTGPQVDPQVMRQIDQLTRQGTKAGLQQAQGLIQQHFAPKDQVSPMTPDERRQWQVPENMSAGINRVSGQPVFSPPNTNIALNTTQKGQEVMATKVAEDFQTAQGSGRDAVRKTQVWDAMEKAAQGFTPGATADIKLQAKRILKDFGVIGDEGVSDAEAFKLLQQQLAIHNQPKGQGSVSNYEREIFSKSIPNMTLSPEGLQKAIQISRSLDNFDRQVAQIYRESARRNQGVPNAVDVNDEIEKLGAPISARDMNLIQRTGGDGAAATPAAAPTGQSQQPVQVTSPDEARKLPKGTRIILPDGSPGVVP